jgi:alkyl hydroperoxide reductase subunit AhpC/predicted aconitase with swiveling domain
VERLTAEVERLTATPVIAGRAEGAALVSAEAVSFWGDVDPATGRVTNPHHPLRGERLAGRVLVVPTGRGSCTTSNILLELIRTGQAPAAIVSGTLEPVLAVGPLVGEALYGRTIPMVTVDPGALAGIRSGDWLVVDAVAGAVERWPAPGRFDSPRDVRYPGSAKGEHTMALRLGDIAPDFTAESTAGPIRFHEWIGDSWAILFSHPRDFTPVCTTELGYVARLKPEFDRRKVKAIGLSVDPVESHRGWAKDIQETQGHPLNFPIIADPQRTVANLYGMMHPSHDEVYTVRTVFVIDPQKKIRLMITYPQTTGRNFDEILRVLDSLQLTDKFKVATPVNWKPGEDVIIVPAVSDEDAKARFPKGWKALRPYLRLTPQPDR